MPIPREFYYYETQSGRRFTREPTGVLDADQLVRGKAPWVLPSSRQLKQKKLIIADWTARFWSQEKILAIQAKLSDLIDAGFELYIKQAWNFIPFTKQEIPLLAAPHVRSSGSLDMSPPEQIKAAVTRKLHFANEELMVLDDYWLDYLLQAGPRTLYSSHFLALEGDARGRIIKIIKTALPPLSDFVIDEFQHGDALKKAKEFILPQFPSVTIRNKYSKVKLGNEDQQKLLLEKSISFESLCLTQEQMEHVWELTLNGPLVSSNLRLLLNFCPNLQVLSLSSAIMPEDYFNLAPQSLAKLKELKVSSTKLTSQNVHSLLLAAPSLLSLYISDCNNLKKDIELVPHSLNDLQSVYAASSSISVVSLKALLTAAPNLKSLDLKNCLSLEGFLELAPCSLLALEKIEATNSVITTHTLQSLLNAAPHVKSLAIPGCKSLTGVLTLLPRSLLDLKLITLAKTPITAGSLQNLLSAAPNVVVLDLSGCDGLSGGLKLVPNSLTYLKKIQISKGSITLENLQELLKAAPNLQELEVSDCPEFNGLLTLIPGSLSALTKLKLANKSIRTQQLQVLLNAAPNLKVLELIDSMRFMEPLILIPDSLLQLEAINAIENSITTEILQALLSAAPNLKELCIGVCEELIGDLVLLPDSLSSLRSIKAAGSSINTISLQNLLRACPYIQELEIDKCKKLTGELSLLPGSLLNLVTITAEESLNCQQIQSLLLAAPNVKKFDMSGKGLLDSSFDPAVNSLFSLQELNIASRILNCSTLESLLVAAPNVERLEMQAATLLGEHLALEADSLRKLKELDIGLSTISEKQLLVLLEASPNLKTVNVYKCSKLNYAVIEKIKRIRPHITFAGEDTLEIASEVGQNSFMDGNNQVSSSQTLEDPLHNPTKYKDSFDKTNDFLFKNNTTRNQGMIIERLCQYLTLTGQHLEHIPRIQQGICNALSHFFIEEYAAKEFWQDTLREQGFKGAISIIYSSMSALFSRENAASWEDFMTQLLNWDGQKERLTSQLEKRLLRLWTYVERYQFASESREYRVLGDNLPEFLEGLEASCILVNPWHAITVTRIAADQWQIYDPNYVAGPKLVSRDELLNTVHRAIGKVVAVEASSQPYEVQIEDINTFIAEGGLLLLAQSTQTEDLIIRCLQRPSYSPEAIEGLLLLNVLNVPAWVVGLQNPHTQDLTKKLLEQMLQSSPHRTMRQLLKSIKGLPEAEQKRWAEIIVLMQPQMAPSSSPIMPPPLIEKPAINIQLVEYYQARLKTWSHPQEANSTASALSLVHEIIHQKPVPNRLIELTSSKEIEAVYYSLHQHCQRPIYYIHSPEDVVCAAPFISLQADGTGLTCKGPGGPLHDFLTRDHGGQAPVLVINYETFLAEDIVRLNTLLDKERRADGTRVPQSAQIIGLLNTNKPDCYQGSDFYSRFDRVQSCPVSQDELAKQLPAVSMEPLSDEEHIPEIIDLFNSSNWKDLLFGHWILDGTILRFQEGALSKTSKPVELHNAPLDDPDFMRFWREAKATGIIHHASREFLFPSQLSITKQRGYDWEHLKKSVELVEAAALGPGVQVLNPSLLAHYLNRYTFDEEHHNLIYGPGILESAQGKHLELLLTRALNNDEWALFLSTCQKHKVTLSLHCAPGVTLPAELEIPDQTPTVLKAWQGGAAATEFISSTDVDTTVALLTEEDGPWQVIDLSECTPSELLMRLNAKLNQETLHFEFSQQPQALLCALSEGKRVILKGSFSQELADQLAPLLLSRMKQPIQGQLVLVSDQPALFNYLPTTQHVVTQEEKKKLLEPLTPQLKTQLEPLLEIESLSSLRARCALWHENPERQDDPWAGMNKLTLPKEALTPLDVAKSEEEAEAFKSARRKQINSALLRAPYVFIAGLSGVGKSTFMTQDFAALSDTLYQGEDSMEAWAKDQSTTGRKLLFLDEANLSNRDWSEFEGLFHHPPSILINGVLHPLSPEHQVIFAGNPTNYGGERHLAKLFQRHGNSIVFTPLPTSSLYCDCLKPIMVGTPLEQDAPELAHIVLEVYRFLVSCSTTEALISPRELQTMALLTLSHCTSHPEASAQEVARYYAYTIANKLVPKEKQEDFNNRFKPKSVIPATIPRGGDKRLSSTAGSSSDFLITPSRQSLKNLLDDLFALRRLRQQDGLETEAQLYGGIGGLIIEGDPAVGKSELVIHTLLAHGFNEEHDFITPSTKNHPFYRMPVSFSLPEKKALLLKAFHEGTVVLIDEINSSPMMERFLNDLLMGKDPQGKRPNKPGFMIIGTQNPITMAGRRAPSTALSRRLINTELTPYPTDEMNAILQHKGLPTEDAKTLVEAFQRNLDHARKNHLKPLPCFRDVIRVANEYLRGVIPLQAQSEEQLPQSNPRHQFFKDMSLIGFQEENPVSSSFFKLK
jgi:hypothetical protein